MTLLGNKGLNSKERAEFEKERVTGPEFVTRVKLVGTIAELTLLYLGHRRMATVDESKPEGELLLRTLAMPADTNANGDIFGGWIMSQMDIAAGIYAKELARGRVVTVSVDGMQFIQPVKVGDVVCCYGKLIRTGTTSITMNLQVWISPILREDQPDGCRFKVTEAIFTFVAIDSNGKKRALQ